MLRFGIIGCGKIAGRHAEQIQRKGKLVAVCDSNVEKANQMGQLYGANSHFDIDQLLAQEPHLDILVICTPNGLHAQHSISALAKSCHVICEKPMALSVKECAAMIETAQKNNKQLFVVKQNRYNPPVQALKNAIDEGRLGKIYNIQVNCFWNRDDNYYKDSWKGTKELDGGTLFTQFSHFIDLVYWIAGDVKQTNALLKNFAHRTGVAFEDTGVILFEFVNGIIGTLHYSVNSFGRNMEGSITVFGETGTIKIGGQYLNELEYQAIQNFQIDNLSPGNPANQYGLYQGSMSNHHLVYDDIVQSLESKEQSRYNRASDGLKTVEIIRRIYDTAVYL